MFGSVSNGLTLGKMVSGISKSLSVINQLIPLYKEIKPVLGNAKTILGTLKEIGNSGNSNPPKTEKNKVTTQKKEDFNKEIISNNAPIFFN